MVRARESECAEPEKDMSSKKVMLPSVAPVTETDIYKTLCKEYGINEVNDTPEELVLVLHEL